MMSKIRGFQVIWAAIGFSLWPFYGKLSRKLGFSLLFWGANLCNVLWISFHARPSIFPYCPPVSREVALQAPALISQLLCGPTSFPRQHLHWLTRRHLFHFLGFLDSCVTPPWLYGDMLTQGFRRHMGRKCLPCKVLVRGYFWDFSGVDDCLHPVLALG